MKTRINNKSNNKHPAEYQVPLTFKFVVTIEDRKKRYFVHGDCTQTSRIIVFSNRCLKHESNIPVYIQLLYSNVHCMYNVHCTVWPCWKNKMSSYTHDYNKTCGNIFPIKGTLLSFLW